MFVALLLSVIFQPISVSISLLGYALLVRNTPPKQRVLGAYSFTWLAKKEAILTSDHIVNDMTRGIQANYLLVTAVRTFVDTNDPVQRLDTSFDTSSFPSWSNGSRYIKGYREIDHVYVLEFAAGWPFRSVVGEYMYASWLARLVALPGLSHDDYTLFDMHRRFLWWRVAANTIFWTCILLPLVLYMPRAIRFLWRLRSILRVRRGQCSSCGYPIPGQAICPECGTRVNKLAPAIASTQTPPLP